MTQAVQQLLNSFDRLPKTDQHAVFCEILKRTDEVNDSPLDDETLNRLAEERFLDLDAEEARNGRL